MSIGNEPAYPAPESLYVDGAHYATPGLTKRELFAAMAMQGWLANKRRPQHFLPEDDMAYCVTIADALLAQLSKAPQP